MEGDNPGDIYPALQAVKDISMESRGVENKAWVDLVDAGIADALCKNVCEMVVFFQALPNMPKDLLEKVTNEVRSPYFGPLEILCYAGLNFTYPPTKTDQKVITALRKNWSEMMDRIWREPESTLRPEDSHTLERMVVAQLLLRIIVTDPTFISILYKPSDLTVQIIARHWKYSQNAADTSRTGSTLYALLEPNHPRQIAYVRRNGLELAKSRFVSMILAGVGPTALSSKQQQAKALMVTFAEHLVRLTGRNAAHELDFLKGIIFAAKEDAAEPEVLKAALKATPLWNAMFRVLKKSARASTANDQEPGALQDPETDKKNRMHIMSNVIAIAVSVLHKATFEYPGECEPLIRIWANENLFGALEETIELLVEIPGMTMQLSRLGSIIETTISKGTPSTLRLFRTQFPRWRILGTLVRHDIKRQQVVGFSPVPTDDTIPAPDSSIWDHRVWQAFGSLQFTCVDEKDCGKRGCDNPGNIICKCQAVKYCSKACLTKDAKDHQLVCGQMLLFEDIRNKVSATQATSPSVQTAEEKREEKRKEAQTSDILD